MLILTSALIVLKKVGSTIHCSRLLYRQSYIKWDLRYTGLDQCIDSPTYRRTYDTLVSTRVSIVLHKVGLMMHWPRLVYRQPYKKQDLRYAALDQCIDSPTKSRTYDTDTLVSTSVSIVLYRVGLTTHWSRLAHRQSFITQDLRCTGLDHCINSPIVEQNQWFVGLKTAKNSPVGLSTRHVGLLIHSVGLQICRAIARRNIDTDSFQRRSYTERFV